MKWFHGLAGLLGLLLLTGTVHAQTVIANIHNAPGWQHSHPYSEKPTSTALSQWLKWGEGSGVRGPFIRVVNGPGWDEVNNAYIPGKALNAYQMISAEDCTSGASGGPTGTGGSIQDGTCIWKYLSPVDYVTLTGWLNDDAHWAAGSLTYRQFVTADTPLRSYQLRNTSGCRSTVAPTGTSVSFKTADGCQWSFIAPIIYSSGTSYVPHETFTATNAATLNINRPYQASLWNDAEYLVGSNNEGQSGPLGLTFAWFGHNDRYNDSITLTYPPGWPSPYGYVITLSAAPGESFGDTLGRNDLLPLNAYSIANGVGLHNTNGPTLVSGENTIKISRMQIKSDNNHPLGGVEVFRAPNDSSVEYSLLEGMGTVEWGATIWFANDLFISHSKTGVAFDYPGIIAHSTIVCPAANCNIGVVSGWNWVFNNGLQLYDNAIFGFAHAVGSFSDTTPARSCPLDSTTCLSFTAQQNITDAPIGDSGTNIPTNEAHGSVTSATVFAPTGITYGISSSAAFASWPGNYRIKNTSPLYNTKALLGNINPCPHINAPCPVNTDTPDILGAARPR